MREPLEMATIALVDDDRNILTSVSIALESEGYRVETYTDGASALEGSAARPPNLAILDIKMPRMDGMELLRRLRQKYRPAGDLPDLQGRRDRRALRPQDGRRRLHPQAVLAAPAGRARQGGAAPRVGRARRGAAKAPAQQAKSLERGPLVMDQERHTCTWKGEPVTLTVTEFLILHALAQRPGVVKSRDALMDSAYDEQVYVDDRTIDSHIKRLRKKFKAVDDDFEMIETLYGVGYRFREAEPRPGRTQLRMVVEAESTDARRPLAKSRRAASAFRPPARAAQRAAALPRATTSSPA